MCIRDSSYKQVINDKQLREIEERFGDSSVTGLKVGMGAESIRELLMAVDLEKESEECKKVIGENPTGQKAVKAIKRLEVVESFRKSGNLSLIHIFCGSEKGGGLRRGESR